MPIDSEPSAATPAPPSRVTVFVCTTCRDTGAAASPSRPQTDGADAAATAPVDPPLAGAVLAEALAHDADPAMVDVRPVRCLANCSRGPSAVLAHAGAWTYVFGNLSGPDAAPALLAGARLLATSADGLMPWRGRPEPLKKGLIARIPPMAIPSEALA